MLIFLMVCLQEVKHLVRTVLSDVFQNLLNDSMNLLKTFRSETQELHTHY